MSSRPSAASPPARPSSVSAPPMYTAPRRARVFRWPRGAPGGKLARPPGGRRAT
ncbi:MAG TPA: hypothetical protein VGM56_22355 [Byssovorax sp.]